MISNIQKRFLLFLFGCIPTRLLFAYLAHLFSINSPEHLKLMGYIALLPAIGFLYLYFSGTRKTGPEVFGDKIWWNSLRPIHAGFYLLFAYFAIVKQSKHAWMFLLGDAIFGLVSFLVNHGKNGNFQLINQ